MRTLRPGLIPVAVSLGALSGVGGCGARSAGPTGAGGASGQQSVKERTAELRAGLVQVVTPKREPEGITYEEPLPRHLLPYHVRNDDYRILGSAFTLDGEHFISAAHLFQVERNTLYPERLVRDQEGEVHEIARITRYSLQRDLAEFTLESYPAELTPLEARGQEPPEIGEEIFSLGYAHGEGLALRRGNVSSFSPEPNEGAWKYIRFSAAVSPGNSGGPLLDSRGRVAGVVVMRSSKENLNFATPMAELEELPRDRAEFFRRGLNEDEAGKSLTFEWEFSSPLPATLPALRKAASASYYQSFFENRRAFEEKHAGEIFPEAPGLKGYLAEQAHHYVLAELDRQADGRWGLNEPKTAGNELAAGQRLYAGKSGDMPLISMERSEEMSVKELFDRPRLVLDAVLKQAEVHREMAGKKIRVTSLGEPAETEVWSDAYGRRWRTSVFHLWGDSLTALHCTPYPRGVACFAEDRGAWYQPFFTFYAQKNARRWMLSYDGRLEDWVEFLELPPRLRPKVLRDASVELHDGGVRIEIDRMKGEIRHEEIGPESILFAATVYARFGPASLRIEKLDLRSREERGVRFQVAEYLEAGEENKESYREYWEELSRGEPPLDGEVAEGEDWTELYLVGKPREDGAGAAHDLKSRVIHSCHLPERLDPEERGVERLCERFQRSLRVERGGAGQR